MPFCTDRTCIYIKLVVNCFSVKRIRVQHYMHGVYYCTNVIVEIAIMTLVLWEVNIRVNDFTVKVTDWL